MSAENEQKLEESLKRFGWVRPVLCRELGDETLEILGGAHRVEIAKRLGHETIPVLNLGKVDDKKAKEISLLDNARYGADDGIALADLIEQLEIKEEISEFLPYTDEDIDVLFSGYHINFDELDTDVDEKPKTKTKPKKTHQIMRFKLEIEDAENVSNIIEDIQRNQGFSGSDGLTNAGDTLVWIINKAREHGIV